MSVVDGLLHRLRVLLRGESYADEQAREIRFHLELAERAEEPPATRTFGNATFYREEMRAASVLAWTDRLRQNTAYAARGLRRSPGFSLAVIATIALGAGLNATMFSLLDRVLMRPPAAVAAPAELRRVYVDRGYVTSRRGGHVSERLSYPEYRALREAVPAADILVYTEPESLTFNDGAVTAHLSYVSSNYFSLLAVRPTVGRAFGADEARIETPTPVIVISERLWRGGFGADPNILGKTIRVGQLRPAVVGIMPGDFAGVDISGTDAWMPINMFSGGGFTRDAWYSTGGGYYLTPVLRARASDVEASLISRGTLALRGYETQRTGRTSEPTVLLGSIIEARGPGETTTELALSTRIAAVAAIVLFIACANVATLLLVRATRRRREIAVRRALGASQRRLYEQVIVESVLLASLGGIAALGLAEWGGAVLRAMLFPHVNWVGGVLDGRVAVFVAIMVLGVGVVAGLAPAATSARADVMNALRVGATESAHRRAFASSLLLAVQAALCVVLVVGAGLFVRSFANVQGIDVGFDTNGVGYASLTATPERRWGPEVTPFLAQAALSLRSAPGVRGAALVTPPPMSGMAITGLFRPNGDSLMRFGNEFPAYTAVSPEFFSTIGLRVVSGRVFTDADGAGAPRVVVVSKRMAHLVWPQSSPLGQCLIVGQIGEPCTTVVGIVEDVHRMAKVAGPAIQFFLPLAQIGSSRAPAILVRGDPKHIGRIMAAVRSQVLRDVSGSTRVFTRTLDDNIAIELRSWRVGATLFTAFGLLALCVAAIGIYSVVAYAVSQRTHEMGVRIALGASVRDILDLVVRDRLLVVGAGVAVGIAGALALGRFVTPLLFGVTSRDPSTLLGAAAVLTAIAIAASLVPAWRAARTDPATALRAD